MTEKLRYLEDRWDENVASKLDAAELLRYRSNLLGSDLRITNFGGGNTSSKLSETDPIDRSNKSVLWIKGSGGDIGSIQRKGFATLYMDKLNSLTGRYRGVQFEDEMVEFYPICTFGNNGVAASIDTPLHGFLPFKHIDHLHPDAAIAIAAAKDSERLTQELFDGKIGWVKWQRPGFDLGLELEKCLNKNPEIRGIILGSHGLFT